MAKILLLNGPNLGRLGVREPALYGSDTLAAVEHRLRERAEAAGHELLAVQSDAEHELIAHVHRAGDDGCGFAICNFAAFTHTSIALRDALLSVALPFIEVHISNVFRRESFRHQSLFSDVAVGLITGLGVHGYELALEAAMRRLDTSD